ncbi:MAG: AAA family ATPase [Bacilli bacterium]|nr:AAA family ATPase [Bacilli bacterium]
MAEDKVYFTYTGNPENGETLIANIGSEYFKDELEKVMSRIRFMNQVELAAGGTAYPLEAPGRTIGKLKGTFYGYEWMVPAFVWDENNDKIISIILVNKSDYKWAYVIDAETLKAVVAIYDQFYIDEGDGPIKAKAFFKDIEIVPDNRFQAIQKKTFRNTVSEISDAEGETNEEDDFVMPDLNELKSFNATKNKKPKGLSEATVREPVDDDPVIPAIARPSFSATKKKNFKSIEPEVKPEGEKAGSTSPKQSEAPDERDALEAQKKVLSSSGFTPNSKPSFLSKNPAKRFEKPQIQDEEYKKPDIQKVFISGSNSKPKTIVTEEKRFRTRPSFEYRPNRKVNGSLIVVNEVGNPFENTFLQIMERLSEVRKLSLNKFVMFCPGEFPDGDPRYSCLSNFKAEDWRPLVMTLDAMNNPIDVALGYLSEPAFCVYLSIRFDVELKCVTTNGFTVLMDPYLEFYDVLELCDGPEELPEELLEETVVEPEQTNIEKEEDVFVNETDESPQNEMEELFISKRQKPLRRLFVTERFRKEFSELCDKHPQAETDMFHLYEQVICSSDEDLLNILSLRDNKNVLGLTGITMHKMRLSNRPEYGASRIFFINGYDSKRRMESSDFIFVGISDEDEHDEQGTIAASLAKYLRDRGDSVLLHKILMPENAKEDPGELAYLSERQIALLDHTQNRCPLAFCGSAGTGKTLLSMSSYLDLVNNGLSTLYLTYQEDLCKYVTDTLRIEGGIEPNCMTFKDLCAELLPNRRGIFTKYAGRAEFREWFLQKADKDRSFKTLISVIGNTDDERFMTSYVFYNGVIRGSIECFDRQDGRLPLEQFLRKTGKEEGYSVQQREAIYKVALLFDKYLREEGLITANDMAKMLLLIEKKIGRYDAIIIDEYQDLTELQFRAVLKFIKSTIPLHLFLYGDDNQSINPTIFNVGDAERIVKETFNKRVQLNVEYLNDSYRSGASLVRFINEVNIVKKDAIGAQKKSVEAPEVSLRDDDDDLFALLVRQESSFKKAIVLADKSNRDTVFIFPESQICEAAKIKYSNLAPKFVETSFLSVEQAKGREWDSVILYNFFSSSSELFESVLGEERAGRHSTLHRMLFNRFYVALTRAKNRIIVYEDTKSKLVEEKILSHLSVLKDVNELEAYFAGTVNLEHWIVFGNRLFKKRDYEGALRAYTRADGHPDAADLIAKANAYINISKKKYTHSQTISLLLGYKDYRGLSDFYESNGERKKSLLLKCLRDETESGDDIARMFRRTIKYFDSNEKEFFFALTTMRLCRMIENQANINKDIKEI